jgi:hypothetical protein
MKSGCARPAVGRHPANCDPIEGPPRTGRGGQRFLAGIEPIPPHSVLVISIYAGGDGNRLSSPHQICPPQPAKMIATPVGAATGFTPRHCRTTTPTPSQTTPTFRFGTCPRPTLTNKPPAIQNPYPTARRHRAAERSGRVACVDNWWGIKMSAGQWAVAVRSSSSFEQPSEAGARKLFDDRVRAVPALGVSPW